MTPRAYARKPDPAVSNLRRSLAADVPGQWTDNRLEQARHFRGVIYLAVRAVQEALASATVQVVRPRRVDARPGRQVKALATPGSQPNDTKFVPVDRGPLVDLLDHPNPSDTTADLISQCVIQEALTGNVLVWAVPNAWGQPVQLYCLPTALCWAVPPSPRYPKGAWRVTSYYPSGSVGVLPSPLAGGGAVLDAREILHLKRPHPLWRWDGYSPLTACAHQLDLIEKIDRSCWAAMDRGISPDAVMFLPNYTAEQVKAFQASIDQEFRGPDRRGGLLAVGLQYTDGDKPADLKPFSTAPKDMDYGGSWDRYANFALACFGVPKAVAGLANTGSYAELYAALKQFHLLTLRPQAKRYSDWLTKGLCPAWEPKARIQLDLPRIEDDQLLDQQLGQDAANGTITWNEYRAARNRPVDPVDGDLPVPLYVAKKQQDNAPPPPAPDAPPAGVVGVPEAGPPQPDNPMGEGSLPPKVGKAMSYLDGTAGGSLVPPPGKRRPVKLRRNKPALSRRVAAVCKAVLDDLERKAAYFREEDHPRDHGKFASKPSAGSGAGGDNGEASSSPPAEVSAVLSDEEKQAANSAGLQPVAFAGLKRRIRPVKPADLNKPVIHLWHGTTAEAARAIARDRGLKPGARGRNASASVAHASQYPEETGSDMLVLLAADPKSLDVDPNDQVGDTVEEGLFPKRRHESSTTVGNHRVVAVFDLRSARRPDAAVAALDAGDLAGAITAGVRIRFLAGKPNSPEGRVEKAWSEADHPRDHGKFSSAPGGGGTGTLDAVPVAHSLGGLAEKHPELKADAGTWAKAKKAVKAAHAAVYERLVAATPAMLKAVQLLGHVLDTPDDLKKFGYEPAMGLGHASMDPLKQATGVPAHMAAAVASHVLGRAAVWAKHKLRQAKAADADTGDWLADLIGDAIEAAGGACDRHACRAAVDDLLAGV